MHRSSVDFPEPEGPAITTASPVEIERSMSSKTRWEPKLLRTCSIRSDVRSRWSPSAESNGGTPGPARRGRGRSHEPLRAVVRSNRRSVSATEGAAPNPPNTSRAARRRIARFVRSTELEQTPAGSRATRALRWSGCGSSLPPFSRLPSTSRPRPRGRLGARPAPPLPSARCAGPSSCAACSPRAGAPGARRSHRHPADMRALVQEPSARTRPVRHPRLELLHGHNRSIRIVAGGAVRARRPAEPAPPLGRRRFSSALGSVSDANADPSDAPRRTSTCCR